MKKAEGYVLRQIADESVLIPYGKRAEEVNEVVTLSETAAFIYKHVEEITNAEEMVQLVSKEYQVPQEIVREDVKEVLKYMRQKGYIL